MARLGAISVRGASKIYNPDEAAILALDNCSMEIAPGEFSVLVGPSGCGKTTLLNVIAGFHDLTGGEVLLDNEILSAPGQPAKPGADRIVVFQNGALFPWMTILQNVTFGPLAQGRLNQSEAEKEALEMLETMGLSGIAADYPGQVSSGMRRRAEIARAMMNRPKVLLLDEPFRAMDALTKTVAHQFLLEVYDRTGPTVFFITHDLDEAIFLASKVYIMTTRPAAIKKVLEVDLPRPRNYKLLASSQYQKLRAECQTAVREEALKAFTAGEREM
ncbi:MAG: ABC transporter ATP-binding protein [Deltaproteobacteria bacterium]|jgi:NitT/TauT family transport system ATP-binding protein|nr:ABC transporter ATP-binding protein [Deltaproteobacteria bacterium]